MKIFWSLFSALIIGTILCLIFFYFKFNYVLGKVLSSKFGTEVLIKKITFDRPDIDVNTFTIKNPPGFMTTLALRINKLDISAPYSNYFQNVIDIDEIEISDIDLNIEFTTKKGSISNWSHLLGSLSSEPSKKPAKVDSKEVAETGRYAVIKLLKINNLKVNIITPGQKTQTKVFKNMQFKNVITEKGDITRRITQIIIYHMIFNYKNLIQIPEQFSNKATDGVLNIFKKIDPFKLPSE